VGKIDLEWVRENVEQLYAEAAQWHANGEDFRIPEALWAVAGQHQEAARERTGAEDVLSHTFADVQDCYVLASDLPAFASERNMPLRDVRAALMGLGFKSTPIRRGTVDRAWVRGNPDTAVRFKLEIFVNRPAELKMDTLAMAAKAVTGTKSTVPPCPVGLPPLPAPRGQL
jgi:hypothetical protein